MRVNRFSTANHFLGQITWNKTGVNGNGILKACFLRRNNNFNLEFVRACVRSFYDGASFHKVLKDRPNTPEYSNLRQEWGAYIFKTFQNVAPS